MALATITEGFVDGFGFDFELDLECVAGGFLPAVFGEALVRRTVAVEGALLRGAGSARGAAGMISKSPSLASGV